MSDRAEAALEERYKSNPRHTPSHHYYKRGFLDGYAAAKADCEAKVRQAVELALKRAVHIARNSSSSAYGTPQLIAEIDDNAIVAQVMGKEGQ